MPPSWLSFATAGVAAAGATAQLVFTNDWFWVLLLGALCIVNIGFGIRNLRKDRPDDR